MEEEGGSKIQNLYGNFTFHVSLCFQRRVHWLDGWKKEANSIEEEDAVIVCYSSLQVAMACIGQTINGWKIFGIHVEKAYNAYLHCVDWNPQDENLILTGSVDNSMHMFGHRNPISKGVGSPVHKFEGHTASVLCVQWFPDKASVFGSVVEDGYLNVWDYEKESGLGCVSQAHGVRADSAAGEVIDDWHFGDVETNYGIPAREKYIFLPKLWDFVVVLCDFLEDKAPYIKELEEQM